MEKICRKCKQTKSLDDFFLKPRSRDGHHPLCKACLMTQQKAAAIVSMSPCLPKSTPDNLFLSSDLFLLVQPAEALVAVEPENTNPSETYYCKICDAHKDKSHFTKTKRGPKSHCKDCVKLNYQANRQTIKKQMRRRNLAVKFGITEEQYTALYDAQSGLCAICRNPETRIVQGIVARLSIDHDHATGKIRGLLCGACNVGLGFFKDNVQSLEAAIEYLAKNSA